MKNNIIVCRMDESFGLTNFFAPIISSKKTKKNEFILTNLESNKNVSNSTVTSTNIKIIQFDSSKLFPNEIRYMGQFYIKNVTLSEHDKMYLVELYKWKYGWKNPVMRGFEYCASERDNVILLFLVQENDGSRSGELTNIVITENLNADDIEAILDDLEENVENVKQNWPSNRQETLADTIRELFSIPEDTASNDDLLAIAYNRLEERVPENPDIELLIENTPLSIEIIYEVEEVIGYIEETIIPVTENIIDNITLIADEEIQNMESQMTTSLEDQIQNMENEMTTSLEDQIQNMENEITTSLEDQIQNMENEIPKKTVSFLNEIVYKIPAVETKRLDMPTKIEDTQLTRALKRISPILKRGIFRRELRKVSESVIDNRFFYEELKTVIKEYREDRQLNIPVDNMPEYIAENLDDFSKFFKQYNFIYDIVKELDLQRPTDKQNRVVREEVKDMIKDITTETDNPKTDFSGMLDGYTNQDLVLLIESDGELKDRLLNEYKLREDLIPDNYAIPNEQNFVTQIQDNRNDFERLRLFVERPDIQAYYKELIADVDNEVTLTNNELMNQMMEFFASEFGIII